MQEVGKGKNSLRQEGKRRVDVDTGGLKSLCSYDPKSTLVFKASKFNGSIKCNTFYDPIKWLIMVKSVSK